MNSFVQCSLSGVSMASFISGLFDAFQPRMPVWGAKLCSWRGLHWTFDTVRRQIRACSRVGTGKSHHLAQAIGQADIHRGYRETHKLLDDLAEATIDGTRKECMEPFVSVPLLIIDELD
jgi:IstB-like ATP binding protein